MLTSIERKSTQMKTVINSNAEKREERNEWKTYLWVYYHIVPLQLICSYRVDNLKRCIPYHNQLFDMSLKYLPAVLQKKKKKKRIEIIEFDVVYEGCAMWNECKRNRKKVMRMKKKKRIDKNMAKSYKLFVPFQWWSSENFKVRICLVVHTYIDNDDMWFWIEWTSFNVSRENFVFSFFFSHLRYYSKCKCNGYAQF